MGFGDKMTIKEHKSNIIVLSITLSVYSLFLWNKVSFQHILTLSVLMMAFIGTGMDIVKGSGGSSRYYTYSKETNQKLRYMVLIAIGAFLILAHKILFCDQLKIFSCAS